MPMDRWRYWEEWTDQAVAETDWKKGAKENWEAMEIQWRKQC